MIAIFTHRRRCDNPMHPYLCHQHTLLNRALARRTSHRVFKTVRNKKGDGFRSQELWPREQLMSKRQILEHKSGVWDTLQQQHVMQLLPLRSTQLQLKLGAFITKSSTHMWSPQWPHGTANKLYSFRNNTDAEETQMAYSHKMPPIFAFNESAFVKILTEQMQPDVT